MNHAIVIPAAARTITEGVIERVVEYRRTGSFDDGRTARCREQRLKRRQHRHVHARPALSRTAFATRPICGRVVELVRLRTGRVVATAGHSSR